MTETQEKITSAKLIEEQEILKKKYETELKEIQQQNLSLQNIILNKDNEIFELQKANEGLGKDRDEWKTEAHRNRKIELEKKQTKETNDFLTEFAKLQEAKLAKGGRI